MPPERQTIFAEMLKPNFSEWDAETSDEILAHPRFLPARIAFVDAVLDLCEDHRFLTRLLLEGGRYVTSGNIVCMHARYLLPMREVENSQSRKTCNAALPGGLDVFLKSLVAQTSRKIGGNSAALLQKH